MANEIAGLTLKYKTDGIEKSTKDVSKLNTAVDKSEASTSKLTKTSNKASASLSTFAKSAGTAALAYVSLRTAISSVRAITQATDKMALLEARLQGITDGADEFNQVYKELRDLSGEVGVEISENINLYQSLKRAADDLGASVDDVLQLQEAYNKLGIIGGASADAMKFSMRQFTQAMAGGILRAEEFNSIVENTPEIAASIAKGMGMTVGQLRLAVIEGNVLSRDVFDAILSQTESVNERFEELPRLVSQSKQSLDNAWTKFLSEAKISKDISESIATIYDGIASALNRATESTGEFAEGKGLDELLEKHKELTTEYERQRLLQRRLAIQDTDTSKRTYDEIVNAEKLTELGEDLFLLEKKIAKIRSAGGLEAQVEQEKEKTAELQKQAKIKKGIELLEQRSVNNSLTLKEQFDELTADAEILEYSIREGLVSSPEKAIEKLDKVEKKLAGINKQMIGGEIVSKNTQITTLRTEADIASESPIDTMLKGLGGLTPEQQAVVDAEAEKFRLIEQDADRHYASQAEKAKALSDQERVIAETKKNYEDENHQDRVSAYDRFQEDLLTLAQDGSKEALVAYKLSAIAQTIMSTYKGAQETYTSMAQLGPAGVVAGAAMAGVAIAAGMSRVNAIRSSDAGSFESGGIIGGNSFSGDNLTANVNSGEMILNSAQQKKLFDQANGKGSSSGQTVVRVNNYGSDQATVTEQMDGINKIVTVQVGRAMSQFRRNIYEGGNQDDQMMRSTYNLTRSTTR